MDENNYSTSVPVYQNDISVRYTTPIEVAEAIDNLKDKKVSEPDGITTAMLK